MANKSNWIDYNAIVKKLENIGNDYALQLKSQLLAAGKKATGSLIQSIEGEARIIDKDGGFVVEIKAADHLIYVDQGRRAGAKPPPIAPIEAWLKIKGIAASPYAVARSIVKNGIKSTNVLEKTMDEMQKTRNKDVHDAIVAEVQRALEKIAEDSAKQINKNKNVAARLKRK